MAYYHLGDDAIDAETLALVHEIRKEQERAERFRQMSFWITVGGSLFAAVRMGILFAPKWKRQRVQEAVSAP